MSEFPNVDKYCELDLGADSPAVRALLDDGAIEREASLREMRLTDITGAEPAMMTNHMGNWYRLQVDSLRRPALDEINAAMQAIGEQTGVPGNLLERKLDDIQDKQVSAKRNAKREHQEKRSAQYSILDEYRKSYQAARNLYEQKKAELRREPKMIGWFYWAAIIFIGIFEAFINFEAFSSLSFMTPAVALGSTMVIAILLALSSHLHGQFLAEFQHRFGDHRRPGDVWAAWRIFGLGTVGLFIVLAAVWYARANYLRDAILEAAVIGGTPPSWLATVGGSLLMNMGVWVAGVIISFMSHDSDPSFPEAKKASEKHGKKFRDLEAKLNGEIEREFRRINAEAENGRTNAHSLEATLKTDPRYQAARKQFERLTGQDSKVMGLLHTYQTTLAARAEETGLLFTRKDELLASVVEEMSTAEYAAVRIKLKYL